MAEQPECQKCGSNDFTTRGGYQACRPCNNESARNWRRNNPEQASLSNWKNQLRRRYGLTVADYDRMLADQDGHCFLCPRTPEANKRLAVDHDHVTGKVRRLLCDRCNTAIGLLGEDPDLMRRAAEYVETHKQ